MGVCVCARTAVCVCVPVRVVDEILAHALAHAFTVCDSARARVLAGEGERHHVAAVGESGIKAEFVQLVHTAQLSLLGLVFISQLCIRAILRAPLCRRRSARSRAAVRWLRACARGRELASRS